MTTTILHATVRPIRFGFLVPPRSRSLLDTLLVATRMWGGTYSGLIPVLRRFPPSRYRRPDEKAPSARQIVAGYVEAFEPDLLVSTDLGSAAQVLPPGSKTIPLAELRDATGRVLHGVDSRDQYQWLYDMRYRFSEPRRQSVAMCTVPSRLQLFGAATFGGVSVLPKNDPLRQWFLTHFDTMDIDFTPERVLETLWFDDIPTPLKMTCEGLHVVRTDPHAPLTMFFMDPNRPIDVIDLWNFRALGIRILPLPSIWADSLGDVLLRLLAPSLDRLNGESIELRLLVPRYSSRAEANRSLTSVLREPRIRMVTQDWQPRVWDRWARPVDGVSRCTVYSEEQRPTTTCDEDGTVAFEVSSPPQARGYSGLAQWAYCVRAFGSDDGFGRSTVLPTGIKDAGRLFQNYGIDPIALTSEGVVATTMGGSASSRWKFPTGTEATLAWIRTCGLKCEVSPAGSILRHVIRSMKGSYGVSRIAHPSVIRLLSTHGDDGANTPIPEQRWHQVLLEMNDGSRRAACADSELLIELGVLHLGANLKCVECQRHSWFGCDDIASTVRCRVCGSEIHVRTPIHDWALRRAGAFAAGDFAQGAIPTALTFRFLLLSTGLQYSWATSFSVKGDGPPVELDFGLWLREPGWRAPAPRFMIGEAKSHKEFRTEEFHKLSSTVERLRGTGIVISTLRDGLTARERRSVRALVRSGRRRWYGDVIRSPVLILTERELLNREFGHLRCWEGLDRVAQSTAERQAAFDVDALCRITQQLYL